MMLHNLHRNSVTSGVAVSRMPSVIVFGVASEESLPAKVWPPTGRAHVWIFVCPSIGQMSAGYVSATGVCMLYLRFLTGRKSRSVPTTVRWSSSEAEFEEEANQAAPSMLARNPRCFPQVSELLLAQMM